jgi:hypothetical protein
VSAVATGSSPTLAINRNWLLLGLILLLGAGLRVYDLSRQGFWIDEFCTLSEINGWGLHLSQLPPLGIIAVEPPRYTHRESARPLSAMITGLSREDAHPPLYFLLLRGWTNLLNGDSESDVRSLNVLLSLVGIVLLYAAVRQQQEQPPAVALWACLLMAVAGPQIEFAQEARNYIPLQTLALAAALTLLRLERRGCSAARLLTLTLTTAAMLLTHYAAAPVIAAMGLYALWMLRGRPRQSTLIALAVGVCIFVILWGPMVLRQRPIFSVGHAWLLDSAPHRLARLAILLLRLPIRLLIEPGDSPLLDRITWLGPVLWAVVLAGLLQKRLRFWCVGMLLIVSAVAASDASRGTAQLKFIRFTLAAAPGLYVVLASAGSWKRVGWLVPAAASLLAIVTVWRAYAPPWKIDFRTPALAIADRIQPTDALIFVSPPHDDVGLALTYAGIRHYLPPGMPDTVALLQSPANASQVARLAGCRSTWVVWLVPQERPLDSVLPGFAPTEPPGQVPYFVDVYHGRFK